jgi:antitoxin (DNA-binding transcriptional repressor) of toxin-antitoxin stability system
MTRTVSVDEAQERLPDLLAQALAGNEIIITEHGKPVARWFPFQLLRPARSASRVLIEAQSGRAKTLTDLYRKGSGWVKNETLARLTWLLCSYPFPTLRLRSH